MAFEEPKTLDGITITQAFINEEQKFVFIGQRFQNDDAWADSLTYIIFYDGTRKEDQQWIVHRLKYLTDANGVVGAWCDKPEPMWIFGYINTGYIEKFDENDQMLSTEQMPKRPFRDKLLNASFNGITSIKSGHVYTAEILRGVWKRKSENKWSLLSNGIPDLDYYGKDEELANAHGFNDIAGFSDNDLYACGGKGDLWHYDGNTWKQADLPTNDNLEHICCGDNGLVYITTSAGTIIYGKDDLWKVIKQDITNETFENIVWYQNKCLINTQYVLYEVVDGVFSKSSLNDGIPNLASIIATKNNILLTTSRFTGIQNDISYYDGKKWHKIIHRKRPPKKTGEQSLLEMMKELEE